MSQYEPDFDAEYSLRKPREPKGSCGRIFNRHHWNYIDDDKTLRICGKCGQCENREGFFGYWWIVTFDDILESLKAENWGKNYSQESRQKALKYLEVKQKNEP